MSCIPVDMSYRLPRNVSERPALNLGHIGSTVAAHSSGAVERYHGKGVRNSDRR